MEFAHPSARRILEKVSRIFTGKGSIFERKDRYLVFVCGGPVGEGADSLRSRFLMWAKTELPDVVPVLAENAYREAYSDQPPEFINLGRFEKLIAGVSDCVLIFPESIGSYAEMGLFSGTPIKKKLLVANEDGYFSADSFLNLGPISHVNSTSLLRPAIPISRERAEQGFEVVKQRLGRLKRRSNRRQFRYLPYRELPVEDKLVAVLATVVLLRAVTLPGLVQSVKITFGTANRRELQHLLSILTAGKYILRSDEYFMLNPSAKPFLEFERIYLEDVIGEVTLFYQLYYPRTLECLRSVAR